MAGSTTIKFAPSDLTALASASGSATVAARTPSTREARQVATEASTVSKIATPEGGPMTQRAASTASRPASAQPDTVRRSDEVSPVSPSTASPHRPAPFDCPSTRDIRSITTPARCKTSSPSGVATVPCRNRITFPPPATHRSACSRPSNRPSKISPPAASTNAARTARSTSAADGPLIRRPTRGRSNAPASRGRAAPARAARRWSAAPDRPASHRADRTPGPARRHPARRRPRAGRRAAAHPGTRGV